jgi:molybdopterin synthase catalytic subunit
MDLLSQIVDGAIESADVLAFARHPSCGAVASFEGTIRNENKGRQVVSLLYEAYDALFHKINEQLFEELKLRWDVRRMAVVQRVGTLQVGDVGIVIALSSPHRRDALEGVQYCIEEFKKRSPVWKKETTAQGNEWINWPMEHQSK